MCSKIRPSECSDFQKEFEKSRTETSQETMDSKFSEHNFYTLMRYERLRLVTYLLFGHQWPKMDVISPSKLAAAGFFYYKNDSVKCAFCRMILSDWKEGDDPLEEHRKNSPNCDYFDSNTKNVPFNRDPDLNSETVENSFTSPSEVITNSMNPTPQSSQNTSKYNETEIPRFGMWSNKQDRARSFQSKLWTSPVNSRKLSDAGFFFTGKEDRTRCFHCGGMLYQWKKSEDPMEEHARYFPRCYFLHTIKGRTYVEFIQFKTQIIQLREKMQTPSEMTKRDVEAMKSITYNNFLNMKQSASKLFEKLENTNSHSPDGTSSNYYQRYLKKFFFLMDCQVLFQHLVSMEIMEPGNGRGVSDRAPSPISDTGYSSDGHESSPRIASSVSSQGSSNGSIFSFDDGSDSDDSNYSLRNSSSDEEDDYRDSEAHALQSTGDDKRRDGTDESMQCIICCENRIEIVFTPCGHLLACRVCSDKLDKCPVCKNVIKEKVRTFFVN